MKKLTLYSIPVMLAVGILVWLLTSDRDEQETSLELVNAETSINLNQPLPKLVSTVAVTSGSPYHNELPAALETDYEEKISESIRSLIKELEDQGINSENFQERRYQITDPLIRIDPRARIQVYIHLSSTAQETVALLQQLGVETELTNHRLSMVQGWVQFDRIDDLIAQSVVNKVEPSRFGRSMRGSRTTEGDSILLADILREFGVDGSGVKVGVISDGAEDRSDAQATGDLPGNITLYGTCEKRSENPSQCDPGRTCNEGTAMLEIIHDIAPEAELAMGSVNTSLEFIQRIDDLADDFQADIVVDDIGFLNEPFFADGAVSQAMASRTDDIVFVSSAGNSAYSHYEADYQSFLPAAADVADLHDFGQVAGGLADDSMDVVVDPGRYLLAILQWNDRFGESDNDYDFLLARDTGDELLCAGCTSQDSQNGNDDPIEAFCYYNVSNQVVAGKLAVSKFSGLDRRFELLTFGGGITREYNISEGSIFGHPAVSDVIAVGAINAQDPGNDDITFYSSRGPARIDFPFLQNRPKPDLVAIDGVAVTGTGGFPAEFFGTSAAAPHVAAIAALLKQAAPNKTAQEIRSSLTSGAVDLGLDGSDNTYGTGRIDAMGSLRALMPDYDSDTDGDLIIDILDQDDDNDGVPDDLDAFPDDGTETDDTDGDGTGNNEDLDDDGDGFLDGADAFPLDASEWQDANNDGIGDNQQNSSYSIDTSEETSISGLFYNPDQSGWGANVIQQFDVAFVTVFTYGPGGLAYWYVASNCEISGNGCSGELHEVSAGSELTDEWNGDNLNVNPVGTISFLFTDKDNGTMTFTINGVSGSKVIERQIWRTE